MVGKALLAWLAATAAPQAGEPNEPIVTDRPDFTESAVVVPKGSLQIESGLTRSHDRVTSGPELLLRYGTSPTLEWRLGLPNYNAHDEGGPDGWDDTYLGLKLQLGPLKDGTNLALIPAVLIPTGRKGVRSESTAPEIKICWSRALGERSLSGMIYVASTEEGGRRATPIQHTLSLGFPLQDRLGAFVEHVLDLERQARPAHTLHTGLAYQPKPDRQFDLHLGLGLTPAAPDHFVGLGYALRL